MLRHKFTVRLFLIFIQNIFYEWNRVLTRNECFKLFFFSFKDQVFSWTKRRFFGEAALRTTEKAFRLLNKSFQTEKLLEMEISGRL